jgi:copper chaperone CopZ
MPVGRGAAISAAAAEDREAKKARAKKDGAPRSSSAKLEQLGDGKISFRMAVRIKHWQARSRRKPVPKGKVFVEKLVNVATSHAPGYGPQTGPKEEVDPLQQRWAELNDPDYANQVHETRKRVRQIREDREFLLTCYDLLDSNDDGKLEPDELEHWAALLLADHGGALEKQNRPRGALRHWMSSNESGSLTEAERYDLQIRLEKQKVARENLVYDWQDFLLVTLDFYTLAGTLAMHRTFCELLSQPGSVTVVGTASADSLIEAVESAGKTASLIDHSAGGPGVPPTARLNIGRMTSDCVEKVRTALVAVDGVQSVDVDLESDDGGEALGKPAGPPPVVLPRPPVKLRERTAVRVVQAGSWAQQQGGARERSRPKHRQPRLPLPPVPADVLGPPRPRQPLRPMKPVPIIGPGTPKRQLRALRSQPPVGSPAHEGSATRTMRRIEDAADAAPADELRGPSAAHPESDFVAVQDWSEYQMSLGYAVRVGPNMKNTVDRRVNEGMMPEVFRQLAVASARPARRVTQLMKDSHAGERAADATSKDEPPKYGWGNNLPVVIIPGLCSSGLEVKKSDVAPEWQDQRVWFSIEKLGQHRSAATRMAAKAVTVATAPVWIAGKVLNEAAKLPENLKNAISSPQSLSGSLLRFHLHRARNLSAKDSNGLSDPTVRVQLLDHSGKVLEEKESSTKDRTRDPYWNEELELCKHIKLEDVYVVRLIVEDHDGALVAREYMGEVDIQLRKEEHSGADSSDALSAVPRAWHTLQNRQQAVGRSRLTTATIRDALHAVNQPNSSRLPSSQGAAVVTGEIECWAEEVSLSSCSDEESENGDELMDSVTQKMDEIHGAAMSAVESTVDAVVEVHGDVMSAVDEAANVTLAAVEDAKLNALGRSADDIDRRDASMTHVTSKELKGLDTKMWLRHMALAADGHSDPPGIEVRAVQGLSGVDYLQPGHMMGATTWVFGPVIDFLKARGYDDSNLKGAPYDWRMPPMYLEQRDQYFTTLCRTIEDTYRDNGDRPVVLLAHSMGNNMAHYFCNWVVNHGHKITQVPSAAAHGPRANGGAWLEKYVYSLFGIGGPYLGACEALRSCITGDDFGMGPALLAPADARSLCQAMGSGAWLLPTGRMADQSQYRPLVYDKVDGKTEKSVKFGDAVNSGHYEPRSVEEALRTHDADHVAGQKKQWYDRDQCMPGGSSGTPPPLKRVFHVYGTNLDTQVGFAFKGGEGTHELDTSLNLGNVDGDKYRGGIILETSDSSQRALDPNAFTEDPATPPEPTDLKRCSGDGTVPYVSLQHTLSWNSPKCLSQVVELDRAEHREILDDGRFHKVLGDYLCDTLVVYVVAARNLAAKDILSRSSDPYCVVTLHTGLNNPQQTTKTHKKTLNPEFNEAFAFGSRQPGETGQVSTGDVLHSARVISIEVRDSDLGGLTSEHIGTMALPFGTILESPSRAVNGWFKLMPKESGGDPDALRTADLTNNGEIFVHFELESAGQSFRGVPDHMDTVSEIMRTFDADDHGSTADH